MLPRDLTFDVWPLVGRTPVEVDGVRLETFLKDDGTLRPGTRLSQDNPGDLPFVETGPDTPGSVTVVWRTDPPKTDAVQRWLLEALPPADLRDPDSAPVARQTVKGDKRRATVRLDLAEEDITDNALLVVRLTAVDAKGQPVLLRTGAAAVDESQQFAVRWEEDPVPAAQPAVPRPRRSRRPDWTPPSRGRTTCVRRARPGTAVPSPSASVPGVRRCSRSARP